MVSHLDMQKIRINGFFYENRLQWWFEVCYYSQYVPAFKPFDHTCFEVLEAIILCCT